MTQLTPTLLNGLHFNGTQVLEGSAVANGDGTYTFTVQYNGNQLGAAGVVTFSNGIDSTESTSASGTYYGYPAGSATGTLLANDANDFLVSGIGALVSGGSGSGFALVSNTSYSASIAAGATFIIQPLGPNNTYQSVACFAAGTRIATAGGDVRVENLAIGDMAVTLEGSAGIVWIGHRRIDCRRHPRPQDVRPVRVRAGAFAPGSPQRDLLLSPDHCVFVTNNLTGPSGALIPVRHLVNGVSIVQDPMDSVTYYHVELPSHAVILAEGLTVESYLDTGNRAAFANAGVVSACAPDFRPGQNAKPTCAPMVTTGAVLARTVDALKARMDAQVAARQEPNQQVA